ATYMLTVTNAGGSATSGTVTVTDTLPAGLTATAIDGGATWTCTLATLTCTRNDALTGGSSFPPITLTVNVAADAAAKVTNTASVSGGSQSNTPKSTDRDLTVIMTRRPDPTRSHSH